MKTKARKKRSRKPEHYEAEYHHRLGRSAAWEEASSWLTHASGEAFAAGHDERAKILRGLAERAAVKSKQAREYFEEFWKTFDPEGYAVFRNIGKPAEAPK